jgi:hypothetical protein
MGHDQKRCTGLESDKVSSIHDNLITHNSTMFWKRMEYEVILFRFNVTNFDFFYLISLFLGWYWGRKCAVVPAPNDRKRTDEW